MLKRTRALILIALIGAGVATGAGATEKETLGTLSVSDILLRPSFLVAPQSVIDRGFNLGESSFAVKWEYEKSFSGHFRVGPESLVDVPAHYVQPRDPSQITIVEAYAEMKHPFGRFRLGKLPLEFGLEGAKPESDLIFPRALLFERHVVGLRDLGFSYQIEYNGFFTGFAIHNGEGGTDRDGAYWYTGRWGYNFEKIQLGLAGQTGKTTAMSTANSTDTLAAVDITQSAKWRLGGIFGTYHERDLHVELEAYWGERIQDADGAVGLATGHLDIGYDWTDRLASYLRYDAFDPDLKKDNDAVHRGAVALVWTSKSRTNRWIGMYAHDLNENHNPDDQYRLIWSLSSASVPLF